VILIKLNAVDFFYAVLIKEYVYPIYKVTLSTFKIKICQDDYVQNIYIRGFTKTHSSFYELLTSYNNDFIHEF
jgi:hypothetical protein